MLSHILFSFARLTSALSKAAAVVAAFMLAAMIIHTLLEIVLRSFFNASTFALDEFIGYGLAATTALSAAHALEEGNLIRVTLVTSRLDRSSQLARLIEVASCAIATGLIIFLVWHFAKSVMRNYSRGTVSETIMETPLWIPESLVIIGLLILTLRFLGLMAETTVDRHVRQVAQAEDDSIKMQGA